MTAIILNSSGEDSKHEGDVTCVLYKNGYVYTGGADGKIKIWNKDLNLIKTLAYHEAYIYAVAVTSEGKLYSSSSDGTIKFLQNPLELNEFKELVRFEDEIECLAIDEEDNLFTGDDKGVVTKWVDDKILFKFNLVEHVKSLTVEKNAIYTVRDLDAVVTEIMAGKSGKYATKATIAGKSPLTLVGPTTEERRNYLAFATRDGKGVTLTRNLPGQNYSNVWTKEDCHEMIINAICGTDKFLYTGGWDGMLKKWSDIEKNPKLDGEINIGSCINSIAIGPEDCVYIASTDGVVRRVGFS